MSERRRRRCFAAASRIFATLAHTTPMLRAGALEELVVVARLCCRCGGEAGATTHRHRNVAAAEGFLRKRRRSTSSFRCQKEEKEALVGDKKVATADWVAMPTAMERPGEGALALSAVPLTPLRCR